MPELPQIQPRGGISVPGTVGVRAGVGGTQVAEMAENIAAKATEMQLRLNEVDRYNRLHTAQADFVNGSDAIFDNAKKQFPSNPDLQENYIRENLATLKRGLVGQYGEGNPELGPALSMREADDNKRAGNAATAQRYSNAVDNLETSGKATTLAYANESNQAKADQQILDYGKLINSYVNNGIISYAEGQKRIEAIRYDSRVQAFRKAGLDNPMAILPMSVSDIAKKWNILPSDIASGLHETQAAIRRDNDLVKDQFDADKMMAAQHTLYGGASPAQVEDYWHRGLISPEEYEFSQHHPPSNIGKREYIAQTIATGVFPSAEAVRQYGIEHIDKDLTLDPVDKQILHAQLADTLEDYKTTEGAQGHIIAATATATIKIAQSKLFGGGLMGYISPANQKKKMVVLGDINTMKAQINAAKTVWDKQKIADDYMKKYAAPGTTVTVTPDAASALSVPITP